MAGPAQDGRTDLRVAPEQSSIASAITVFAKHLAPGPEALIVMMIELRS